MKLVYFFFAKALGALSEAAEAAEAAEAGPAYGSMLLPVRCDAKAGRSSKPTIDRAAGDIS